MLAWVVRVLVSLSLVAANEDENSFGGLASEDLYHILPAAMLGTWESGSRMVTTVQGPFWNVKFLAAHGEKGASFFALQFPVYSLFENQSYFIQADKMQACFTLLDNMQHGETGTAPFQLHSKTGQQVTFCWRGPRANNFAANCTGCSCAKYVLELSKTGTLEISLLLSPPVMHFRAEFDRTGPAPSQSFFSQAMGNRPCPFVDTDVIKKIPWKPRVGMRSDDGAMQYCLRMDGHAKDSRDWAPDLRFQYSVSTLPCMPCNVTFSLSAAVREDEYIALGFKEFKNYTLTEPGFLGMASTIYSRDEAARQFPLLGRIVLGHASSSRSCVRDMKVDSYVGMPVDSPGVPALERVSGERRNGRTVFRFTVPLHLPWQTAAEMSPNGLGSRIGGMGKLRIMWAIGSISSRDCEAPIGYHAAQRGVSALMWFNNVVCPVDATDLFEHRLDYGNLATPSLLP